MQQRSFSAGLTLYLILVILAIAGLSAGLSIQASAQTGPSASSAESYILGPNDRIRLKVYGEPDITGEYEISNSGQVSIPLAGHIKAAGATTRQLEKSIAAALAKGIVRDPRVNVEIAQYRPYYILGEVKKSGEYPYRHGLTVLDAVASAGGCTYRANENKVFLRRAGAGAEETYPLDAPVPVYPGDNIRIPERYF
jgi:polysaccharide export outer membrane protein